MNGFIEVTLSNENGKIWFTVSKIKHFCDYRINGWSIMETSEEIKALIEEAQKEDGVHIRYVPYVPNKEPQIVPLDFPTWNSKAEEEIT